MKLSDFTPRHYRTPKGYTDPKFLRLRAEVLDSRLYELIEARIAPKLVEQDQTFIEHIATFIKLSEYKVPIYFVSEALCDSLLHTDLPKNLIPSSLRWPLPTQAFILPTAWSKVNLGHEVYYLTATHFTKNSELTWTDESSRIPLRTVYFGPKDMISFLADTDTAQFSLRTPANETMPFTTMAQKKIAVHTALVETYPEATDQKFIELFTILIVNFMCVLSEMPELTTGGDLLTPALVKGKGVTKQTIKPSLFAPRWLGEHYHRRTEAKGGHHASPATHWRCGHWRQQPFGQGRKQTKQLWIEPVLVNLEISATNG